MVNLSLMMMRPLAFMIKPTYPVTLMMMNMNTPTTVMNMAETPPPLFAAMPSQDCMTTTMIMHYMLNPLVTTKAAPPSKNSSVQRQRRR